jgi:hypothetical protein
MRNLKCKLHKKIQHSNKEDLLKLSNDKRTTKLVYKAEMENGKEFGSGSQNISLVSFSQQNKVEREIFKAMGDVFCAR